MPASSVVAVAGGTGKLGRHIVRQLAAAQQPFRTIVLSRSPAPATLLDDGGRVEHRQVDYDSVSSISRALADVDTLVSCVVSEDRSFVDAELRMLEAMKARGSSVRRFIPSEWAYAVEANQRIPPYDEAKEVTDALTKTRDLEWLLVCNGVFMQYLAKGSPNVDKVKGYMDTSGWAFDGENKVIDVVGDEDTRFVFTEADDIGRAVSRILAYDSWDHLNHHVGMLGWEGSVREMRAIAEKALGCEIALKKTDPDQVRREMPTRSPDTLEDYSWKTMLLLQAEGKHLYPESEQMRKDREAGLFTSLEAFLRRCWKS